MILDAIRKLYEADAEDHIGKGNPTGSRFGACAAQTQYLRFRALSNPEPPRPRHRITWEEGDRVEAWWSDVIERAFPNKSGLSQEPFYFPVVITAAEAEDYARRIALPHADPHRIWGTARAGFDPPYIRPTADSGRVEIKLLARGPDGKPARLGFILDPLALVLWAPTYVDRILMHPEIGLCVLEKKSMSNAMFRRALVGNLGYGLRCQGAGLVKATGLPIVWLCYRKETGHLLEIVYTPDADRVRVEVRRLNGQVDVLYAKRILDAVDVDDEGDEDEVPGEIEGLPGDAEWDDAAVWTPYDAEYLDAISQRIRRVLSFTGDLDTVYREYGPSFVCPTCGGSKTQTHRKGSRKALKTPKRCAVCSPEGLVDSVELGFPCSYCAVVKTCWDKAGVVLTLDQRPHYTVQREAFERSGLTFVSPEGSLPDAQRRVDELSKDLQQAHEKLVTITRETPGAVGGSGEAPPSGASRSAVPEAEDTHASQHDATITSAAGPEGRPGPTDSGSAPAAQIGAATTQGYFTNW